MVSWYYYEFITFGAFSDWSMGLDGKYRESYRAVEVVMVRKAEETSDGFCGTGRSFKRAAG